MTTASPAVVIIHGTYGSPDENWFPWLAERVREAGYSASVPRFSTPEGQSLQAWKEEFAKQVGELRSEMVLVGHSLGVGFVLNLLEASDVPVKGTFLVSAFIGEIGNLEFDTLNRSFVCREFDWERIRGNAGEVFVYNGDTDPYVALSKGREIANRLGVELEVIEDGGHINSSAGFQSFDRLWHDLVPLLRRQGREVD